MKNKTEYISKIISKLKMLSDKAIRRGDYNFALISIATAAKVLYEYNQCYTDLDLERQLLQISKEFVSSQYLKNYNNTNNKVILFYDGFGIDRRGIAIVMCKAILKNGYKLIYVSPADTKNKQPTLYKELNEKNVSFEYFNRKDSLVDYVQLLSDIFVRWHPHTAFFHTWPDDVAGTVVFNALKGLVYRYQIDLTDHAFWLGINAFDKCNGGRPLSSSIQYFYRGIPKEKLIMLDANLFIDNCPFQGLPFDETKRFIFSGGQLYKTLGDKDNTYYRIVDHLLNNHPEVVFLYAGKGDDRELQKTKSRHPGRVFHIAERPDFYQIMQRCTLYLNTYPMFGGLMMRYAALAGKIPVTLKHMNDSDGILIDQESRDIEYGSYEELVKDVDKLLDDGSYLRSREKKLIGSVVTEECFVRNIRMMIEEHKTEFPIGEIQRVNTEKFRREYFNRYDYKTLCEALINKRNRKLFKYFPKEFLFELFYKFLNKIKRS